MIGIDLPDSWHRLSGVCVLDGRDAFLSMISTDKGLASLVEQHTTLRSSRSILRGVYQPSGVVERRRASCRKFGKHQQDCSCTLVNKGALVGGDIHLCMIWEPLFKQPTPYRND